MAKAAAPAPAPVKAAPVAPPAPAPIAEAPAAAPAKTRAVAKRATQSDVPALLARMEELSGFGLEEATGDDYVLPFLVMLQSQSPQLSTVPNAAAGDLFNTASSEIWDGAEGVEVVPCYYQRRYIEWTPRDSGGGFVAIHTPESPVLQKVTRKGYKDVLPNGNELQNTAQFLCLVRGENGWSPVVLAMKGTQLKKARRWLTVIKTQLADGANGPFNPPPFANIYTIKNVQESNDKGRWFGFDIAAAIKPTSSEPGLFEQAFAFAQSVRGGGVKVAAPVGDAGGAPGSKAGFTGSAVDEDGGDIL